MSLGVGQDPFVAHCTFCDAPASLAAVDGKIACEDCYEERRGDSPDE